MSFGAINPVWQGHQNYSQAQNSSTVTTSETAETPFSKVFQNQHNDQKLTFSTKPPQRLNPSLASSSSSMSGLPHNAVLESENKEKKQEEDQGQIGLNDFIDIASHLTPQSKISPASPNDQTSDLPDFPASKMTAGSQTLHSASRSSLNPLEGSLASGTQMLQPSKGKLTYSKIQGFFPEGAYKPSFAHSLKKHQSVDLAEDKSAPWYQSVRTEQTFKTERSTAELSTWTAQKPPSDQVSAHSLDLLNTPEAKGHTAGTQRKPLIPDNADLGSLSGLPSILNPINSPRTELPTPTIPIHVSAHTPEFREALATQLTILAQEGIQEATLQLHPAELGPVSVHIVLDGTQARVEFSVDSPVTKTLLESGWNELTHALQNAGLNFAGGDVSQGQSGSQHAKEGFQQKSPATHPSSQTGALPSSQVIHSRIISGRLGGLDLYA